MEEELEPFVRHGTEEERIKVAADEVLNAVAEGRDIDILYAIIDGDLDIEKIAHLLEQGEDGNWIIRGNVKIQHSEVCGNIDFSVGTFSKSADFYETTFSGNADFLGATFSGSTYFISTSFNRDAIFNSVTFSGNGDFRIATFSRDADFSSATFSGTADFSEVTFGRKANFANAIMEYPAGFAGVRFRENTVPRGLYNSVIRSICWVSIWLLGCAIFILWQRMREKEHKRTDFSRFSEFICNNTWRKVRASRWPTTDFSGFNTATVMDGSSNPYLKRYIDDEQWIVSWRQRKHKSHKRGYRRRPLLILWELTSHCGRSIGLWVFWSAAIAVAFAFIYRWFGSENIAFSIDKLGGEPGLLGYLYYSVVTFTTLGFGDIVPLTNPARLAVGAEVVLGYVMLGGLISVFANKFARRS